MTEPDLPLRFTSTEVALDALQEPSLKRLLDLWREKCAGRGMPARRDILPEEMRFLLGRILVLDVLHDPLRFRFRLVGTSLVEAVGFNPTGKLTTETGPRTYMLEVERHYAEAARRAEPVCHRIVFEQVLLDRPMPATLQRDYLRLLLPLSEDGARVDQVIGASISEPGWGEAYRKAAGQKS